MMKMKIVSTFKIKIKPNEIMGDYIALHGMVPQNELPEPLRWEIPKDEIWIRSNVYNDMERRRKVLGHEECELNLMVNEGMTYKVAHSYATRMEETGDLSICKFGK